MEDIWVLTDTFDDSWWFNNLMIFLDFYDLIKNFQPYLN